MDIQTNINSELIKHSQFQIKLQKLFTKTLKYFTVAFLIIFMIIFVKLLINYFVFSANDMHKNIYNFTNQGTWSKIVNFLIIPEVSIIQSQSYYNLHDLFSLFTVLLISSSILFIAYKVEQNYLRYIEQIDEESLIFLFSLEISCLKNKDQGELFVQILDIIKTNQQICQDKTYIYDMKKYNEQKNQLIQSEMQSGFVNRMNSIERKRLNSSQIYNILDTRILKRKLEEYAQFSGKMLITLNDLETIFDLLSVYHSGLLQEKIKKEKENNYNSLTEKNKKSFQKLDQQKNFIENLKIQLAQDPENIIWDNYSKSRKQKVKQNFWKLFGVIFISFMFFTFEFFFQYFYTKEILYVKTFDQNPSYVKIGSFKYSYNAKTIILFFVRLIMPNIGFIIIQNLMIDFKCATISSTNNYNFVVKTLFELIYRFPASHYGYTFAIKYMKDKLNSEGEKMRQIFYLTHVEWILIILSIIVGSFIKYIFDILIFSIKKFWRRRQRQKQQLYKLDHTIPASNLIISIAFLGFYQSLLSPLSILLVCFNLTIIFFIRKFRSKKSKITLYIDFNNISVLIQLALFSYAIGGLFSFDTQYIYSHRYFVNQGQNQYTFPYFVIANIVVILILTPTLFNLMRHNSISLRILEKLLENNGHFKQQENIPKMLEKQSYSKSNPYEIEQQKINEEMMNRN